VWAEFRVEAVLRSVNPNGWVELGVENERLWTERVVERVGRSEDLSGRVGGDCSRAGKLGANKTAGGHLMAAYDGHSECPSC
jgi:hypothetical protein